MPAPVITIAIFLVIALPFALGALCLLGPARREGRSGARAGSIAIAMGVFALLVAAADVAAGVTLLPVVITLVALAVPIAAVAWRPKIAIALFIGWLVGGVGIMWGRYELFVGTRFVVAEASVPLQVDGEAHVYVSSRRVNSWLFPLIAAHEAQDSYLMQIEVPVRPGADNAVLRASSLYVLVDGLPETGARFDAHFGWTSARAGDVVKERQADRRRESETLYVKLPRLGSRIEVAFDLAVSDGDATDSKSMTLVVEAQRAMELRWTTPRL